MFLSLVVDTSDHLYDGFIRLLFLNVHRETSVLVNELPKELDQFRSLHTTCLTNLKGSVGLNLAKASVMRISMPLDLSSRRGKRTREEASTSLAFLLNIVLS